MTEIVCLIRKIVFSRNNRLRFHGNFFRGLRISLGAIKNLITIYQSLKGNDMTKKRKGKNTFLSLYSQFLTQRTQLYYLDTSQTEPDEHIFISKKYFPNKLQIKKTHLRFKYQNKFFALTS